MERYGIVPILVVLETPDWARGYQGTRWTPPIDPDDYGRFVGMLAARYANRPMAYEVWNEPNDIHYWDTGPDPARYSALLKSAYGHIKAADPDAAVLGGSVLFNDQPFIRGMYAAGARGYLDAFAIHPYSRAHSPYSTAEPWYSFTTSLTETRGTMSSYKDGSPIWITEMGWRTTTVTDAVRATYFGEAVEIVRTTEGVHGFMAYTLNQGNFSNKDNFGDGDWGLLLPDGSPTLSWLTYESSVRGR
jgi:hypothetical protein